MSYYVRLEYFGNKYNINTDMKMCCQYNKIYLLVEWIFVDICEWAWMFPGIRTTPEIVFVDLPSKPKSKGKSPKLSAHILPNDQARKELKKLYS